MPVPAKVNLPPDPKSFSESVVTVNVVPESSSSTTFSKITSRKTTALSPAVGVEVPSSKLPWLSTVNVVGVGAVRTLLERMNSVLPPLIT